MTSNYDRFPVIRVNEFAECSEGWDAVCRLINAHIAALPCNKPVIAIECYHGVHEQEIMEQLGQHLSGTFYFAKDFMHDAEYISTMIFPDVTNDEVFGYLTRLQLDQFFDASKIALLESEIGKKPDKPVFLFGTGAALLYPNPDMIIYFDMPRWEIQLRFRRNEISNLGVSNRNLKASLQYKQAFFVDWRVCDRHKKTLMKSWDFVIDTTVPNNPKIVSGIALNNALAQTVSQPFRLVPFFDPGPWGGQWMKKFCGLGDSEKNFAWGFDCVPEENSLFFQFNEIIFETPAINLVFAQPKALLGEAVQARFGDEFPIRFDFLDTIEGGNLSLQVHPSTEYAQEKFGIHYTQDESYYILDAKPGAYVYLGLQDNVVPSEMISALKEANSSATDFAADQFAKQWPIRKHDHVLIPAGTVHCSGKDSMVLEISATPYIFTFKLWDWGRMGLDGKPRPINIDHGAKVIDWSYVPKRTERELLNQVTLVASGEDWREEKTGLHEREFIETRRHWFTGRVNHSTNGGVNVLNLIEGRSVIVESPTNAFEPFVVHYAETFVIPANVISYDIRPYDDSIGHECATIKAYVRTNA